MWTVAHILWAPRDYGPMKTAGWTELHRHLELSMRLSTLLEFAQASNLVSESTSLEAFKEDLILVQPEADLIKVLEEMKLFPKVLDRPERLIRLAYEAVYDSYSEGTRKIEFRYSPTFIAEWGKLSWDEILLSFEQGLKKALVELPQMQAGLICIATREYGVDATDRTVEFFLKNRSRLIGLDLAGNEVDYPGKLFEKSFGKAKKAGARITVHAGEAGGPDFIWQAIDLLGAERIGHGITCIEDPSLMKYLSEKRICMEMCPTSNWLTGGIPSFEKHPLPEVLRAEIPVCINTDDPSIFGVTLIDEVNLCSTLMGLTKKEIDLCFENATRASFLPLF